MVDMDQAAPEGAVGVPEVKLADDTGRAVVRDAAPTRVRTALVGIDGDLSKCTLSVDPPIRQLIGKAYAWIINGRRDVDQRGHKRGGNFGKDRFLSDFDRVWKLLLPALRSRSPPGERKPRREHCGGQSGGQVDPERCLHLAMTDKGDSPAGGVPDRAPVTRLFPVCASRAAQGRIQMGYKGIAQPLACFRGL